jgi:hypothetical protein
VKAKNQAVEAVAVDEVKSVDEDFSTDASDLLQKTLEQLPLPVPLDIPASIARIIKLQERLVELTEQIAAGKK